MIGAARATLAPSAVAQGDLRPIHLARTAAVKHPQYNPALETSALNDTELNQLEALLAAVPNDEAMDIECLDGYLTALLLGPRLPEPDVWLSRVWGGAPDSEPPFPSGKQTKRLVQWVLRHMAAIDRQLHRDVDQLEPFFAVAERDALPASGTGDDEIDDGMWVDAGNWCIGFLTATELLPDAWEPLFEDPDSARGLGPILLLGADPDSLEAADRALLEDLAGRDRLSREVPDIVSALWHQRHDAAAD